MIYNKVVKYAEFGIPNRVSEVRVHLVQEFYLKIKVPNTVRQLEYR